jgi:hypothetical protein
MKLIVTLHSLAVLAEKAVFRTVIGDVNIWGQALSVTELEECSFINRQSVCLFVLTD